MGERMKVLLHSQANYVRNHFIASLIPRGIALYHAELPGKVAEAIIAQEADILVIDVIEGDFRRAFSLLLDLKNHENPMVRNIAPIFLVGDVDRENLTNAVKGGAVGFIKSGTNEENIANYLTGVYSKVKGMLPNRKFIRVSLDISNAEDRIGIKFRSPINSLLMIGFIRDISIAGMAVDLVGVFPKDSLSEGANIHGIQCIIDRKDMIIDATVVAWKKPLAALRFQNLPPQEIQTISHFIFHKIAILGQ
jgi:hypothetical protein